MVTRSAPSRLTAQERARRAARGGASRSVPAPLLAPALVAVAFLLLPLAGLLIRAPWGHMAAALSGTDATQALTLSLWTASVSTGVSLVIGVALLLAFSRVGLVGRYLDYWFGLTIPFTPLAVIMAETFVAMPFLIITVEGALRSADQGF